MSDSENPVLVERRGRASIVTFNDPQRLNPFSDTMRFEAIAALESEMADNEVRVVILTGAGGKFSAGADIRQMQGGEGPDPARSKRRLEPLHRLVRLIVAGPKPVIAAVEGLAFGAGLSLVAASDFVISAEDARFGAAFGKIGLTADCGLLWSLPQRIGLSRAKDMMLTGKPLLAPAAVEFGLVDRVVPPGKALEAAVEKASEYLDTAPLSIAAIKAGLAQGPTDIETFLRMEQDQQPMLSMTSDHDEGRRAFLEKRRPQFTGR